MCSVCTRWVDHCRGRLCIWSGWGSLPLCSQTTGSSGRSSCPEGRSWFLQTHPTGQRIASGESADTETPRHSSVQQQDIPILCSLDWTEPDWLGQIFVFFFFSLPECMCLLKVQEESQLYHHEKTRTSTLKPWRALNSLTLGWTESTLCELDGHSSIIISYF